MSFILETTYSIEPSLENYQYLYLSWNVVGQVGSSGHKGLARLTLTNTTLDNFSQFSKLVLYVKMYVKWKLLIYLNFET